MFVVISSAPTQNQDADAAWLSNKIYEGVNTMNTDSGCVIKSHQSEKNGAYAVWKHYRTKECYVVIRGTKNFMDFLTDSNVINIYDDEIGVDVHNGVKLRGDFILRDISDGLSVCKRDIIITGHSLGGSVSHYLFLKYVKKHYYDWGDQVKASRFKAVIFGAPQLTSRSNNQFLLNYENNINWYKYESDAGPELVGTIKNAIGIWAIFILFSGRIDLSAAAFATIQSVRYGNYIPGNKYNLWSNGEKEPYRYIFGKNLNFFDHVNFYQTVDAITKKGWGSENTYYDKDDITNCLKMDYAIFLDEGSKSMSEGSSSSSGDEIEIDTATCEEEKDYPNKIQYEDVIFLGKNDNTSYIIKRILDNKKEYEYAICSADRFVLKQCDKNCKCHQILKNSRPKKITMCTSYQLDSSMICLVDDNPEQIELKGYFSFIGQTKIKDYYLMDYYCNGEVYQRGNYNNSEILSLSFILMMVILFLL